MGATVFAGASQFVAVEIWTTPPAVALLTATALMVNLRHVLMGAAMAPHVRGWSRGATYGGLFFMADEIWAFALRRGAERPLTPAYYFGLSLPLHLGRSEGRCVGKACVSKFRSRWSPFHQKKK